MRPWLALWIAGLAAFSSCGAQDDAEADPCRRGGYEDDDLLLPLRRSERSAVPVSLIATGIMSRRSALENNFMRFGRSAPSPAASSAESSGLRPARADNFMRFGRSAGAASASAPASDVERVARGGDHNSNGFIRFGRSKDNYMRFGRGGNGKDDNSNFVRFGRPEHQQSNFVRFGRDPSNFVRFGRDPGSNFVRFGRDPGSNFVRFGRDPGSNFVRFGRDPGSNFVRFGRDPASNFVRFGRAGEVEEEVEDQDTDVVRDGRAKLDKDNYMRFGRADGGDASTADKDKRAKDNYMRFGRGGGGSGSTSGSNFVRFGRSYVDEDESTEGEAAHQEVQDSSRTKRPQGV